MEKIDFLKEWYYKEDERKDCLNNSLNIPIGILTAILAGVYFIINKFNYENENVIFKYLFIVLSSLVIFFCILCIYYLLKSYNDLYKGYSYRGFPHANFLHTEEESLKLYLDQYREDLDPNITLETLVKQNVEKTLVDCIHINSFNNDRKSAYLHKSKIHLLTSIILLFIISAIFTVNLINHQKEEIHKVLITNTNTMPNEERRPPPPPPREQPRVIKEDKQPTRQTPPPQPQPRRRSN